MKKQLLLLVLMLGSLLAGCGLVNSSADRERQYRQINNIQARMFVDDWDAIWLYEKNSGLTQWHPRVGY